jgi:hypothetical protein
MILKEEADQGLVTITDSENEKIPVDSLKIEKADSLYIINHGQERDRRIIHRLVTITDSENEKIPVDSLKIEKADSLYIPWRVRNARTEFQFVGCRLEK